MGWIMNGSLRNETEALMRYAPDLDREPFLVSLDKYRWIPLTAIGLSLLGFGGWSWRLWGELGPTIFFRLEFDERVNHAAHMIC
jgi:hypothetical protein